MRRNTEDALASSHLPQLARNGGEMKIAADWWVESAGSAHSGRTGPSKHNQSLVDQLHEITAQYITSALGR